MTACGAPCALAEVASAKKEDRSAFLYLDLTCKEMLPLWLPPESVGGRFLFPGEAETFRPTGEGTGGSGQMQEVRRRRLLEVQPFLLQ